MSDNKINKTIDLKKAKDIAIQENQTKNFLSTIDYNYPSLNRKDNNINKISYDLTNDYKNSFNLTNKDIDESNTNSKNRYMKFHGTNYSYNTRDIKGAQGDTITRGIITNRHTNPIVPKYKYLGYSEIQNNDNNPYYTGFQRLILILVIALSIIIIIMF